MSYLLVVDDDQDIRDVLEMILEGNFEMDIVKCSSGNKAIEQLKNDSSAMAILTDYRMYDGDGGDLYRYVRENHPEIPVCLISTYRAKDLDAFKTVFEDNPMNGALVKPFNPDDVVSFVERVFANQESFIEDDIHQTVNIIPRYFKVAIKTFLKEPYNCEVFLKLSDAKYVKLRCKDSKDDYSAIEKYLAKGVHCIYMEESDYKTYIESKVSPLLEKYNISKNEKKVLIKDLSALEDIHDSVLQIGVNEKTVFLVDKSVESLKQVLSENTSYKNLLDCLKNFSGYMYAHSFLTSYLSVAILENISLSGYGHKKEDVYNAYIQASLFQNISLSNDPKLAEVYTNDDIAKLKLSHLDRLHVTGHPLDSKESVDILVDNNEIIGRLITRHHEQPNAKGFPAELGNDDVEIHEAIFIIAVNFAHDMLSVSKNLSELKVLAQKYNGIYDVDGVYRSAYRAFLKAFNEIFR